MPADNKKEKDELHREKLEQLRQAIQIGIDQADQGRAKPLTGELVRDIKDRGRKRLAASNPRFREIIEQSRRSYAEGGGIGIDELRRELGLEPSQGGETPDP